MSTWQLLKFPGVSVVIFIYGWVMLAGLAFTAVAPVFWFTDPELGGLGLSPFMISIFLGAAGLSQSLWTLLIFPPLQHRIGTGGVLRLSAIFWPLVMISWPICNFCIYREWDIPFWIISSLATVIGSGVSMAFSKSSI
jgi:hypothetical protein